MGGRIDFYPNLGFNPCPGDPDGVTTLAEEWRDAAFMLTEAALRLDRTDEAHDRWKGQAAASFRTQLNEQRAVIGKLRWICERNASLLGEWADQLIGFRSEADALDTQAGTLQQQRSTERNRLTGAYPDHDPAAAQLTQLDGRAQDLHERYLRAAQMLARRTDDLLPLPSDHRAWYGRDVDQAEERALLSAESTRAGGVVPVDPALRAAWWNGLTPEERMTMSRDHAKDLGTANGLPAEGRNAGNMVLLQQFLAQAKAERDHLAEADPGSRAFQDADKRYQQLQQLHTALTDPQAGSTHPAMYLLGLDQDGPGHAIVCYGNPDTAQNTAVYVPGTGQKLSNIMGNVGRAGALYEEAQQAAPGTTASMVWLGYDAPQTIPEAASGKFADAGGPALADYVNSLALTHEGASHVTVIGHSYGSTLVGDAAAQFGMHADDVVAVGSPGLTVAHASDLHMDPNHVWAGRMQSDPVPPIALARNPNLWGDDYSERYGTDPTSSAFGGRVFAAGWGDAHGKSHSDYWRSDQPSLANMARIVTGDTEGVTVPSTAERDGAFPTTLGPGSHYQVVGGLLQEAGHTVPGRLGATLSDAGNSVNEVGHGENAVAGSTWDLMHGDLSGAGHQLGDAADDAAGAVKDTAKAITDPIRFW
ncbi:alpha/beta hydrolase [Streptomyces sp. NPDC020917]|uniref:alpha/beta hydrolase n=1 Tax=Streptomyces sp. NPDC020917 TaxID=3365102 RepID=UPI00378FEEDF